MGELTHLDDEGRARMVDVGGKPVSERMAVAEAVVHLSEVTRQMLFAGELPKGDAIAVARVAAIQGAKRTADLIPLCHPIAISAIDVEIEEIAEGARLVTTVRTTDRTGVEMEAITAAAVGAVTIYDMVKAVERGAELGRLRLLEKSGGSSGSWKR